MDQSSVVTKRVGLVLEVMLDRPKANAIDVATSRMMGQVFADFRDDPDLRVAIITGAGSGIGAATAECLAEYGAAVTVTDINFEKAEFCVGL